MKAKAGIDELEAHLSGHVRAAQAGEEIVIHDGETPVAKLVPLAEQFRFRIIPALVELTRVYIESSVMLQLGVTVGNCAWQLPADICYRQGLTSLLGMFRAEASSPPNVQTNLPRPDASTAILFRRVVSESRA